MLSTKLSLFFFVENVDASRISARTGDGKVILSHTTGEPYFFTFGKSEVKDLVLVEFSILFLFVYFLNLFSCMLGS